MSAIRNLILLALLIVAVAGGYLAGEQTAEPAKQALAKLEAETMASQTEHQKDMNQLKAEVASLTSQFELERMKLKAPLDRQRKLQRIKDLERVGKDSSYPIEGKRWTDDPKLVDIRGNKSDTKGSPSAASAPDPAAAAPAAAAPAADAPAADNTASSSSSTEELKRYSVRVDAKDQLETFGSPGWMKVYVGAPEEIRKSKLAVDAKSTERDLGRTGKSVEVVPFTRGGVGSGGIEIVGVPKQPQCSKLDDSGAEFEYELRAKESGSFDVGAKVWLYDDQNCKDSGQSKTGNEVSVRVEACYYCGIRHAVIELTDVVWKAFLEFWGKAVAAFFTFALAWWKGKVLVNWFKTKVLRKESTDSS